jgi:hypothetical protein
MALTSLWKIALVHDGKKCLVSHTVVLHPLFCYTLGGCSVTKIDRYNRWPFPRLPLSSRLAWCARSAQHSHSHLCPGCPGGWTCCDNIAQLAGVELDALGGAERSELSRGRAYKENGRPAFPRAE